MKTMKKFTVLASLVLAIFVSLNANAQRLPSSLVHDHGVLVDENGKALTSQQVAYVIGKDLYDETYRGACKQYKIGKGLVLGGAIGTGVGVAAMIGSSVALANGDIKVREYSDGHKEIESMDSLAGFGILGIVAGATITTAGFAALSAGIPLKTIGGKRLNWIAENYNIQSAPSAYLSFGNGKYGTGLILRF